MTKGLKEGEPNGRNVYPDIIDHPHHQSPTRPHMSLYDRVAQFSSFDALAGYTDMVREEQRETDVQIELDETALERLNQKPGLITDVIADGTHPTVSITHFIPNQFKAGGRYETIRDTVKRIDTVKHQIVLMSIKGKAGFNRVIDINRVVDIRGELVDYLDDAVL